MTMCTWASAGMVEHDQQWRTLSAMVAPGRVSPSVRETRDDLLLKSVLIPCSETLPTVHQSKVRLMRHLMEGFYPFNVR